MAANPTMDAISRGGSTANQGMSIAGSMMNGVLQSMNSSSDLLFKYQNMLKNEQARKFAQGMQIQGAIQDQYKTELDNSFRNKQLGLQRDRLSAQKKYWNRQIKTSEARERLLNAQADFAEWRTGFVTGNDNPAGLRGGPGVGPNNVPGVVPLRAAAGDQTPGTPMNPAVDIIKSTNAVIPQLPGMNILRNEDMEDPLKGVVQEQPATSAPTSSGTEDQGGYPLLSSALSPREQQYYTTLKSTSDEAYAEMERLKPYAEKEAMKNKFAGANIVNNYTNQYAKAKAAYDKAQTEIKPLQSKYTKGLASQGTIFDDPSTLAGVSDSLGIDAKTTSYLGAAYKSRTGLNPSIKIDDRAFTSPEFLIYKSKITGENPFDEMFAAYDSVSKESDRNEIASKMVRNNKDMNIIDAGKILDFTGNKGKEVIKAALRSSGKPQEFTTMFDNMYEARTSTFEEFKKKYAPVIDKAYDKYNMIIKGESYLGTLMKSLIGKGQNLSKDQYATALYNKIKPEIERTGYSDTLLDLEGLGSLTTGATVLGKDIGKNIIEGPTLKTPVDIMAGWDGQRMKDAREKIFPGYTSSSKRQANFKEYVFNYNKFVNAVKTKKLQIKLTGDIRKDYDITFDTYKNGSLSKETITIPYKYIDPIVGLDAAAEIANKKGWE